MPAMQHDQAGTNVPECTLAEGDCSSGKRGASSVQGRTSSIEGTAREKAEEQKGTAAPRGRTGNRRHGPGCGQLNRYREVCLWMSPISGCFGSVWRYFDLPGQNSLKTRRGAICASNAGSTGAVSTTACSPYNLTYRASGFQNELHM